MREKGPGIEMGGHALAGDWCQKGKDRVRCMTHDEIIADQPSIWSQTACPNERYLTLEGEDCKSSIQSSSIMDQIETGLRGQLSQSQTWG
jgi:hypothetical protein